MLRLVLGRKRGRCGSRSPRLTQWLLACLQDKLDAGNEIIFTQVGSTLKVQVPNAQKDFASAALCKAMFDIYLGDSPVSPKGKDAMAEVPCPSHLAPPTPTLLLPCLRCSFQRTCSLVSGRRW